MLGGGGVKGNYFICEYSILCVNFIYDRVPFFSYSKDLIIEFLYISEIRIFLILIILISLSLTVIHLIYLFYYLFFKSISFKYKFSKRKLINYSIVLLVFLRILRESLSN